MSQWPEGWEWPYDPERAKQLLKEAGYEDGLVIDISSAATIAKSTSEVACEAVAVMLQNVGINAILKQVPTSVLYPGYKNRTQTGLTCQHDSFAGGEPLSLHRIIYDPGLLWGVAWDHPWYTERMLKAYETFDYDDRWALQLEMGQWMRDNALSMSLYGENQVFPLGPQLDTWDEHLSMGYPTLISNTEYAKHR